MNAEEITEKVLKEHHCSGWDKSISEISSAIAMNFIHGNEYQGDPFKFRPWCGQEFPKQADK